MTTGIILERWAEHDLEFRAKAPAVLASIYSVAQAHDEAERQIVKAKKRTNPKWTDCYAHYLKRLGTVYLHERQYKKSHHAYDQSAKLYQSIGPSTIQASGAADLDRAIRITAVAGIGVTKPDLFTALTLRDVMNCR